MFPMSNLDATAENSSPSAQQHNSSAINAEPPSDATTLAGTTETSKAGQATTAFANSVTSQSAEDDNDDVAVSRAEIHEPLLGRHPGSSSDAHGDCCQ